MTPFEIIVTTIGGSATVLGTVIVVVNAHYKNRKGDGEVAGGNPNEAKLMKTQFDEMDYYLKRRTILIDERFDHFDKRILNVERMAMENRKYILTLIDREIDKYN